MLRSDKLLYFKYEGSKKDSCQRGTILLKDCQIICPFLEYDNRPVSFRVERVYLIVYSSSEDESCHSLSYGPHNEFRDLPRFPKLLSTAGFCLVFFCVV